MTLATGSKLGPYEILGQIGAGGDRIATFLSSNANRSLIVVDLAGKATTLVPNGIRGQSLAWSASGDGVGRVFLTPDGRYYAYGYGKAATSDLYLIEGLK